MSDYRKSRFTLARLMLGICLMNEKVDLSTLFKTQVHVIALMHINSVYDEHCCVFLGVVGTCFNFSSGR